MGPLHKGFTVSSRGLFTSREDSPGAWVTLGRGLHTSPALAHFFFFYATCFLKKGKQGYSGTRVTLPLGFPSSSETGPMRLDKETCGCSHHPHPLSLNLTSLETDKEVFLEVVLVQRTICLARSGNWSWGLRIQWTPSFEHPGRRFKLGRN